MNRTGVRATLLSALCAALLLCGAASAQGATEPWFTFIPTPPLPPAPIQPPPTGYLEGPCGLGVDSGGNFYVSDYYHHAVDVYSGSANYSSVTPPVTGATGYLGQLSNEDPLDGPCGLAFDSGDRLYVNNYHRNVVKFNARPSFGSGTGFPLPPDDTEHHLPTGVAVDPVSGNVYVDNRTYISVYTSAGAVVEEAGQPVRIGLGTLGDGYGLAYSLYEGGTRGFLYVPDASSNTVKVYNPATSKTTPVAEIKDPFNHPFTSLRDSAVAVDRVTGDVYFADNTQPKYTERPQAIIYIFRPTAEPTAYTYQGHLKYNVTDALQPGIAVDNSAGATQGRVYVTSGNTNQAGIYAYGPGSGVFGNPLPPTFALHAAAVGSGSGSITSAAARLECSGSCERDLLAGGANTLVASPEPRSEFAGWSGACSGTDPTCTVAMAEATSVRATFAETESTDPESFPARQVQVPGLPRNTARAKAKHHRHHHHHRGRRRHHRSSQRR